MTDWNAVSAFMASVVAWPGEQSPGFVNLHYSMVNPKDNKLPLLKGLGWPFRKLDDLIQRAAWIGTTNHFKDVWFCTSTQSEMKQNSKGKPKAVRFAANAIAQKSLWVDLDVGPPDPKRPNAPPKYPTVEAALAAVLLFQKTVGLPTPSAIVFSGNGIHVYWISTTPLTPAEWQPYASGLKNLLLANAVLCDSGLTADIARLLRVPGTFNHKDQANPKLVKLSPLPLKLYDFEQALGFLKSFAGPLSNSSAPAPGHNLFADGVTLSSFGKPAFTVAGPDLNAGINREDVLLKAEPIFKQCGFFKEALLTGGANFDQTLWMYSVLGSTFMENGNAIAHAISKEHTSYSTADTQALYDRKVAERADRGIGYPSCSAIQGAGCKSCATCPLFAKGKSPLNIRPVVTATVNPSMGQTPVARALRLPRNYDVNADGIICRVVEKADKEGDVSTNLVPLFQCVLSNFWAQKHPDCLNYTVTVDKGFTHAASVPHNEMSKQGFRAYIAGPECRTLVDTAGAGHLEDFYLSMLGKLRAEAAAQEAIPFGWFEEGGKTRGFVFGGQIMMDDGTVRPCGGGDPNIRQYYTPTGEMQEWFDAAATVTNRKRPELTTIMLMGFASPLLKLIGKASVMYSAWGDTGAGKSAAYKVGMAIWGHPILTKGSEQSTHNSITTQMKEIRNLPFYWDEITDDKHRELVAKIMHEASDGAEKARNLTGQKTQLRGMWKLMIMAASNGSYREFIQERNPNHAASIVRVLEWKVDKIDGGPGHMNDADATMIIDKLESNHGQMGLAYSRYLADNHVRISAEVKAMSNKVQNDFKGGNAERYWFVGAALMILAARYAKDLGVDVDEAEIKKFMYDVMRENIAYRMKVGMEGGTVDNTEMVLARYLKDRIAEERAVWTNYMHNVQGKPPKPVVIFKGPTQGRNMSGGVEIRFAIENREIVIATRDFDPWIKERKHSTVQIHEGLIKEFGAFFKEKIIVASGTQHAAGREPAVILPVTIASPLWDILMLGAPPDYRAAAENEEPPPADIVDTGLDVDMETGLTPTPDVVAFVHGATAGAG